jgi:hypothetical protein
MTNSKTQEHGKRPKRAFDAEVEGTPDSDTPLHDNDNVKDKDDEETEKGPRVWI